MRNKMSIFIAFIILIISFDNNLVVNASEVETEHKYTGVFSSQDFIDKGLKNK